MVMTLEEEREHLRRESAGKKQVFVSFLNSLLARAERGEVEFESMNVHNEERMEIMSGKKTTSSTLTIVTTSKTEN